jgi:Bacterial Ig domain/Calx-beta domain
MKKIHPVSLAKGLFSAFCLSLALASAGFAQTATGSSVPVVTIRATDDHGTWIGDPAVFTVFRSGNPAPALNVYCCISGTASNGVDYQAIGSFVSLPAGILSNTIVIKPVNLGRTGIKTVTVELCPSPLMIPVNYSIGSPSRATVYITPPGVSNLPPVVTVVATDPKASEPGVLTVIDPGIFTIYRTGGTNDALQVYYSLSGTASNGVDYTTLSNTVVILAGASSADVIVNPLFDKLVEGTETVVLRVLPPVCIAIYPPPRGCYLVGSPSEAIVYIADNTPPPPGTNLPPVVRITSPPNGAVFRAPVNIPIYTYAADPDGFVTTVEFFAGSTSLGFGWRVTAVPPPLPPGPVQPPILIVVPTNYWELVWTNPPLGTNLALTARATDNGGASAVSAPVLISILPSPPPPTNQPPIVSIVATDPVAIEGTNCWPWLGLASATPAWSNWFAASATYRLFTNCGPKDATFTVFRFGATNDDLDVAYNIGGTATNGIDYVALPGLVTIPAGERRAAITILPLDDGPPDITSTVILKLVPGTNYLLGYPQAAATIILDSQSPRAVTGMVPGAAFNLSAAGPDGAWFHVEYSTDLIHWTPVCANQVVNGRIDFVDPDAATNPARFYRTVPEAGPPSQ